MELFVRPEPLGFRFHDGGREASGRRGFAGDCVTRAAAILRDAAANGGVLRDAAEMGGVYDDTYRAMAAGNAARGRPRSGRNGVSPKVYEPLFRGWGFRRVPLPGVKPTLAEAFAAHGPGVVVMRGHLMTVADGVLADTYDRREYGWCSEHDRRAELAWDECVRGWGPCPITARERKALGYFVPA